MVLCNGNLLRVSWSFKRFKRVLTLEELAVDENLEKKNIFASLWIINFIDQTFIVIKASVH